MTVALSTDHDDSTAQERITARSPLLEVKLDLRHPTEDKDSYPSKHQPLQQRNHVSNYYSSLGAAAVCSGPGAIENRTVIYSNNTSSNNGDNTLYAPLLESEYGSEEESESPPSPVSPASSSVWERVTDTIFGSSAAPQQGGGGGDGDDGDDVLPAVVGVGLTSLNSPTRPSDSDTTTNMVGSSFGMDAAGDVVVGRTTGGPLSRCPVACRPVLANLLRRHTVADALPHVLATIQTNGMLAAAGVLVVWFALVLLWVPVWALSFLVTEYGVYAGLVATIYGVGRGIVRLIAFPGSSHRVFGEIETEFARYSVRMLESGASSMVDVASAILDICPPEQNDTHDGDVSSPLSTTTTTSSQGSSRRSRHSLYDISNLWKRACSYRDRVLGMYADVLTCLVHENGTGLHRTNNNSSSNNSVGSGSSSSSHSILNLTQHGNNPIVGDIGNLSGLTHQARQDGRALLTLLQRILDNFAKLQTEASSILNHVSSDGRSNSSMVVPSDGARLAAEALLLSATELTDILSSLTPPSSTTTTQDEEEPNEDYNNNDGGDSDPPDVDSVRRRLERESKSSMDVVRSAVDAVLPLLDPPLHASIFGFDVLRGCMLSRYRGGRQLWVRRPDGGMIDVLHLPASSSSSSDNNSNNNGSPRQIQKAVIYCNPNAGLIEVATGMSLIGGNVVASSEGSNNGGATSESCWTEFYIQNGYDVFLFNYAGFGRSFGVGSCVSGSTTTTTTTTSTAVVPDRNGSGVVRRLGRIAKSIALDFKPTPDSLRADAFAVASHVIGDIGVEQLVLHGESIGGMAAAGAARRVSHHSQLSSKLALLICDRTFCNLEATAQRLVGAWTGNAIRMLTPTWSTDVAGDFLAAKCPKVVATDPADAIIADASSLKAGLALAREITKGATKGIGWCTETPIEYRMADWENVGVNDSKYTPPQNSRIQAPIWPSDKHISLQEAVHFAACARRIGKAATTAKRQLAKRSEEEEEGVEVSVSLGSESSSG
eukprot:scaffold2089_cov55-Attheya_sp.AAC.3